MYFKICVLTMNNIAIKTKHQEIKIYNLKFLFVFFYFSSRIILVTAIIRLT